jgi:alkanesulfonate monooxygenase SsuD/methylene tetrahydromethanopterin reductase-like flavin-dependent oxidoreductase (luciferase family)
MYFSLFLGEMVSTPDHDTAAIDRGIEQAVYADEHGFAAVYSGEQHFNNYEPYSDGFMMSSYLAALLKDSYVGISVSPLIIHHPIEIAERMTALDQLAKGKSIVAVSGGRPNEGEPWHKKGIHPALRSQLFDRKLETLETALNHQPGDAPLNFNTGDEHGTMPGRLMPRSYRATTPLYAIATNTPAKVAAAGRAGRLVHFGPFPLSQLVDITAAYKQGLTEGGFDETYIRYALDWAIHTKMVLVADTDEEAWAHMEQALSGPLMAPPWVVKTDQEKSMGVRELAAQDPGEFAAAQGQPESYSAWLKRMFVVGSPETVRSQLAEYDEAGIAHLHARFAFGSEADPSIYHRSLQLFAEEVMPKIGVDRFDAPTSDQIRPAFRPTARV